MSEFKRGDRVRIVWPDAASKDIREKLDGQAATVIRESGSQQVEVELDPGHTWALSDVYIPVRFLELFPSVNMGDRVKLYWPSISQLHNATGTVIKGGIYGDDDPEMFYLQLDEGTHSWLVDKIHAHRSRIVVTPYLGTSTAFQEHAEELSGFRHFLIQGGFSPNEAYTIILEAVRNR